MGEFEYQIWYWDSGAVTSGTIKSRFEFIAEWRLRRNLKNGFRNRFGFFIKPEEIIRIEVRKKK